MGTIYFIRNTYDKYIKVGHTVKFTAPERLVQWQQIIPHKLILLGYRCGSKDMESYLKYYLFKDLMVIAVPNIRSSEWFRPRKKIFDYLEDHCKVLEPF